LDGQQIAHLQLPKGTKVFGGVKDLQVFTKD
jgi:hypothetical protein